MKRLQAGFTLIELLVVIGIIGLLAAAFLPDIIGSRLTANIAADSANLSKHYSWLTNYKTRLKHYPTEGGHKFVLDTWVKGVVEHTPQNIQYYFTPGIRESDPHYLELSKADADTIWPDLRSVTSMDTDYAGRAKEFLKGNIESGKEAWIANDNENGWAFADGSVNILFGDGSVRTLNFAEDLKEKYGWPNLETVMPTFGPDSPVPELKKLDR